MITNEGRGKKSTHPEDDVEHGHEYPEAGDGGVAEVEPAHHAVVGAEYGS